MFRHVHHMNATTNKFTLFKAVKPIAIIASTININGYCHMVCMKTKRCRHGNRIVSHVSFVYNGIARLDIRGYAKFRHMLQRRKMDIGKRNRPTIIELDNMIVKTTTTSSIKTDNKQNNSNSSKCCYKKLEQSLSIFHQHLQYNK